MTSFFGVGVEGGRVERWGVLVRSEERSDVAIHRFDVWERVGNEVATLMKSLRL